MFTPAFVFAVIFQTVLGGVYTSDQAARGREAFAAQCQSCHYYENLGGPEAQSLKGARFMDAWREDNLESLFTKMRRTMPPSGPLGDHDYVDIIAFLLAANALPAGAGDLKREHLSRIDLVGKDGPQPLPSQSVVKSMGCLTAGPNDTWTLTNATTPVRTRRADFGAGTETLQLRGLDRIANFTPDAYRGRKVRVEGVLNRQQTQNRINITSLEIVSPSC